MKTSGRKESRGIAGGIRDVVRALKTGGADAPAIANAAVARDVFMAIASSDGDPAVRTAAMEGIREIDEIIRANNWGWGG